MSSSRTTQWRRAAEPGPGLCEPDFRPLAVNGFGDGANSYVHCMAEFRGSAYAGTSRNSMALLKLFPPPEPAAMDPWPVSVPDSVEDLDMHGQIWRLRPDSDTWERAYTSPDIPGKNGTDVPRDLGYRGMAVFQGASDDGPALYVGAISTVLRGDAARLLRSVDGEHFEAVGEPGLGNPNVSTLRAMTGFDGHLYVPPAGEGITLNSSRASVIMRCADPLKGPWAPACEPGFGEQGNTGVFEMAVFADHLYAGTFNAHEGYQVWKTPATDGGPCRWTKVLGDGAFRGPRNEIAMSMVPFGDALYVGSAVQNGGYDRVNRIGPAAAEIVRIYADDSWDLLVGEERRTRQGVKLPLSGLGPGFDNPFAGYVWRMVEHGGWLYASTFDWSVFLPYATRPSRAAARLAEAFGLDRLVGRAAGFEIWRTRDGVHWIPVTQNGFGNGFNYGARTLLSTTRGLLVGTANPFGPKVAVRTPLGWMHVENPRGGAEVWQASSASLDGRRVKQSANQSANQSASSRSRARGRSKSGVLVTGGTGFIGRQVLDLLIQTNERVRLLAVEGTTDGLDHLSDLDVWTGTLEDENLLSRLVDGVDRVYHLAGMLPGASRQDLTRVNVLGTENLLRAFDRSAKLNRFVLVSSVAVYGGPFVPPWTTYSEYSPPMPGGPPDLREYGRSKLAAERLVQSHARAHGYEHTIVRPATAYGPGGAYVSALVRRLIAGPPVEDGEVGWVPLQLIHVRDAADGVVRSGRVAAAAGQTINLAGSAALSLADLSRLVRRLAGASTVDCCRPSTRAASRFALPYSTRRSREILGFHPRTTLQEGLLELVGEVLDGPRVSAPERLT